MPVKRTTVLLVCMVDSIHSARWVEQFAAEPVDFILFPSTPNRRVHPRISALLTRADIGMTLRIAPFGGLLSVPLWGADLFFGDRIRGVLLSRLVRAISPDFVHALELNHAGYIAARAYAGLAERPPLISTNWGSDIYWFRRFPAHEQRLRQLLGLSDYYSAECERDIELARELGFRGRALDVFPNAGGFDLRSLDDERVATSRREIVLVKGYESFVGRASIALRALEKNADALGSKQVVVFSANAKTARLARAVASRTGLDITVHPKKSLSHQQMLGLFESARVYIGVSLSDGISTSLLEAMVGGAFPIQTDSSCASEWIRDGASGFVIAADDEAGISEALSRALSDDELVDSAAASNESTARSRLGAAQIRHKSLTFYALGSSSDMSSA